MTAQEIYDVLNSQTFEDWYAKDFAWHGEPPEKTKEEILKDIERLFRH